MDSECASLLPRVCEVLADSRRALPDDTSLEKLLDWFTGLTKSGGCLLETCPCLLDFISSVGNNTALDPAVLSFTLKLTGLLAASEDGFKILRVSSSHSYSCRQTQACLLLQLQIRPSPMPCSSYICPHLKDLTAQRSMMMSTHEPPPALMSLRCCQSTSLSPWFLGTTHGSSRACRH
uniref:BRCA1-associated ATM activator 1 n=1 Tax=Takifugu rubripes TaxID=31033 RepID=A0A3B5KCQ6_TAKRU